MPKKGLEKVLKEKVKPIIKEAMHKFLGVSIDELNRDITEKLGRSPFLEIEIDTSIPFKEAKKRFKAAFLRKILRISYGNISEAAKKIGVNRRSIHRLVKEARIDVDRIREELVRPYEVKQKALNIVIEDVLDHYKKVIHPTKLEKMYKNVSEISKDIMEELPEYDYNLKDAEDEFEREYIKKALSENKHNITKTAKKIGLRYETLLRKMKELGIK